MIIILISIIIFGFEILLLKNTVKYSISGRVPVKIKLWWLIVLILCNIGPISLFTLPIFFIIWLNKSNWELESPMVTKISNFLNKEL